MYIDSNDIGKGVAYFYIAGIITLVVVLIEQLIGCK